MANDLFATQFGAQQAAAQKTEDDSTQVAQTSVSSRESETPLEERLLAEPAAESGRQLSVVGETLVFKGELSAEEDLLIQGQVHGSIRHNASNLTIGAHGHVKADIQARKIIVQGTVEGDMTASESVTVEISARVIGNIFSPRIGIKEGAKFKGSIDMDEAATQSAPSEPKATSKVIEASPKPRSKPASSSRKPKSSESSTLSDVDVNKQLD